MCSCSRIASALLLRPFWVRASSSSSPAPAPSLQASMPPAPVRSLQHQMVPVAELRSLVEKLQGDAPEKAIAWMQSTLATLEEQERDRAALMKRDWSDTAFEDGEDGNERTIEGFERQLVGMLRSAPGGLEEAQVLGSAIDLAGAYKKNYKLDKAEAVLLRCTRHAEDRSGAWMVKYLNHISQVRMKQSRDVEAMEMMYEMESLACFPMHEPGASEFYETLFRNMSSALRRMGREDEAAAYFWKMAEAAKYHKESLDWMDLWDLGVLIANRAYQTGRWPEFFKSREIIAEALRQQRVVEPHEQILRAKVLSNLGQCYLATGEHDQADVYYSEAYELFDTTVGKSSPLFGMQAWACGNLRCAEGRHSEALHFLGEALFVEVVADGLSVSEMMKLLDQILTAHHESTRGANLDLPDASATEAVRRALDILWQDPRWYRLPEMLDLGVLAHKMALVYACCRWSSEGDLQAAASYSRKALQILQNSTDPQAPSWVAQAKAIQQVLVRPTLGAQEALEASSFSMPPR